MKKPAIKFRNILALFLVLALVVGYLPIMTDAAELTVSNKVADPQTLHNWKAYYGNSSVLPNGSTGISTWKAGGVWTDKSVFASNEDITAAGLPASLEDANAFLVALSALASNKQIVGQTSSPTDTMLVLDLSNSMDQSGSVDDMINAANESIHTLLQMNVNNRVGVVLYSGNTSTRNPAYTSSATVILPLDRYTTTTTSTEWVGGEWVTKYQYLDVSGTGDTTVSVASGTRNSNNRKPSGSKNTIGGTYIQNGLYQAYEAFASMTDKGVVQSGMQKGVQRTPVLILMSDGAPTIATSSYNSVGTSNEGDGSSTTNRITFLTQLTASWVKGAVKNHYNNTNVQFYTLGLGTANNADATAVLYPSGTTNESLTSWWSKFQAGAREEDGTVEIIAYEAPSGRPGTSSYNPGQSSWYLPYDNQGYAKSTGRNYVDRYWSASNSNAMISAFQEIVEEIGLQSAYSATLIQSGEANLDGYVTIEDELGSMMQVKDIKGILLGNTLFTGQELAKSMNEGSLGSTANPTAYGDEFVATFKARLGVETSVAQQLIAAAYADDQLYYNAETGAYANYIGWYGDADNNYLGFWDKDTGFVATGAPGGAKYINQSYGFLGGVAGSAGATDMMHIIVMVHTEIATGHQTVLFKVPAALIPMITYKVDLEGDSLQTANDLTLTVTEREPIRLLYEVGLPDDVNAFNLEQKVNEYLSKDGSNHIHKNADGSYTFYANSWGAAAGQAPDISELTDAEKQALTASVAESHFIPNTANERFYVLEDSLVYDSSYSVLSGLPAAGGEYYFARTIVNVTGANGAAAAVTQYERLSAATVANSGNFKIVDGQCVVKAGTIRQTLSNLELEKAENRTNTIGYSDSLWVYVPGTDAEDYNVYSFLGNNGKLTVMPTTGIQVTKELSKVADGASADEKFAITVTIDAEVEAPAVTDASGKPLAEYALAVADGKTVVTVMLADDESVYISKLPAGVTYTVTEAAHNQYSYTYTGASQTVAATFVKGVVTNVPVKPGSLYITKEVAHAHEGETFPADYEFEFRVTFTDVDGLPIANTEFQLANNYDPNLTSLTTDENGVMYGKLRHGETTHILGIPAGTVVAVEEINIPENYTVAYRSRNATGLEEDSDGTVTIVSESNATVVVTNTYAPKSTTVDLDIAGTKIFNAENNKEVLPSGAFYFKVQQWNGSVWTDLEGKTAQVSYEAQEDGTKTFTIADVLSGITFDRAGSYAFRVLEVEGDVANVTYDRTLYTFTVVVADVNGQLTAEVKDLNNTVITDGSYEVTFTNTYHTAPVSVDIEKQVDNKSDNPNITKEGFAFVAREAEVVEGQWTVKEGGATLTVYSDAAGKARVSATYNQAGSYYYILSELSGDAPGWTYSNAQYQIEVQVTADEAGNLTATLIVDGVDQEKDNAVVSFRNVYDPGDAQVDLNVIPTVVKELKGRDLVAGEFTFAIFPNGQSSHISTEGAIAVGTNDEAGNVNFAPGPLTFDKVGKYKYDVVEITGDLGGVTYNNTIYDLVIEVTDPGDGTLEATYYFEDSITQQVSFQNTYEAAPAEAVIEGLKTVQVNSGLYTLKAGDFTFGLYKDGVKIAETSNLANGTFAFEKLVYGKEDIGTHTYEVREIAPDGTTDGSYKANGLTYSGQSFTVTVEVTDNGQGQLVAAVHGGGTQNIGFVNTYTSTPAYVALRGNKTLSGRSLAAGEFRFAIYRSNAGFTQRNLVNDQITNDADGKVTFSFGSLGMGYHYFIIKEVIPEERATGIRYDAGEYHITVQVSDSGNGKMTAQTTVYHPGAPNEQNPSIFFKNTYRPEDGSVIIDGNKALTGGKPLQGKDFSFALYKGDTLLDTADVEADGTFAFDTITYTAEEIGTHTYTVKEVIPAGAIQNEDGTWTLGTITYDPTVYTVVVTVADVDGVLQATKTVEGGSDTLTFTNVHTPEPIELSLEATKSYNRPLKGGDFTFTLEGEGIKKQEKTNGADGKIFFDPVTLTEAKTYTFTVKEKEDVLWGFISWDKSAYTVEVVVENLNGQLVITSQTVKVNEVPKDGGIVFTNEYVLDGEDSVVLSVHKTMTGDRTDPSGFLFGLYDAAGELVQTIISDKDGVVSFQALTFDETHVAGSPYTYTVREILPTDDGNQIVDVLNGITYDTTVYKVVVNVADNGKGSVEATYTVDDAPVNQQTYQLAFTNSYKVTGDAELKLEGTKLYTNNLTGALKELPAGTFQFNLSGEGVNETVSNADGGAFAFSTITYGTADIGKTYVYTVTEVKGDLDYVSYDEDIFTVTVKVSDNGQGGIAVDKTVTCGDAATAAIAFDNYYNVIKPGSVDVSGIKTYTDGNTGAQKVMEAGMFSFRLTGNGQDQTVHSAADGTFAFETIHYTSADIGKEYTYTVSEVKGDKSYITYDTDTFQVKVKIEDNGQGGLKITKTLVGGNEIAFQNTYNTVTGGKLQVGGLKTYIDQRTQSAKEMEAGMFSFRLTGNGQDQTVQNAADGTFTFEALSYTAADIGKEYTYLISEVKGNKGYISYDQAIHVLTVQIEDDGQGGLKLIKKLNDQDVDTVSVPFVNYYHIVSGASVDIDGIKTYEGRNLKGNDFTFVLSKDGQTLQSVKNAADGTFSFETIEYTKDDVGVHTYTVSELHPEGVEKNEDGLFVKDGIVYDANVYTVEVTVTDNGEGGLNVTKKVNNTDVENISVTFDNAYQIFGVGKLELTGTKTLTGGRPLADGEFTFGLYQDGQLVAEAVNVGGSFVITKVYEADELGQYTYTLAEVVPEGAVKNADGTWTLGTITYDPVSYTVNVKVSDDQVGGIAVEYELVDAEAITFENVFTPEPAVITIGVEKILDNRTNKEMTPEGFEFVIALGEETYTAVSDAEGKTGFTVTFHESDIGKTYVLEISEKNTGIKGMTYDKTVHTVTVQVLQNEDGTLSTLIGDEAAATVSLQFTNIYEELVTPPLGDETNMILPIVLMLASLLGVVTVVVFRKKKTA